MAVGIGVRLYASAVGGSFEALGITEQAQQSGGFEGDFRKERLQEALRDAAEDFSLFGLTALLGDNARTLGRLLFLVEFLLRARRRWFHGIWPFALPEPGFKVSKRGSAGQLMGFKSGKRTKQRRGGNGLEPLADVALTLIFHENEQPHDFRLLV